MTVFRKRLAILLIGFHTYLTTYRVGLHNITLITNKMRTLVLTIAAIAFSGMAAIGQENVDVKEETVTKKVTLKDTKVETKVVKETAKVKETLKVEGTEKQDQKTTVLANKSDDVQVIADEVSIDAQNSQLRMEIAKNKEAQLAASVKAEKEKAAKEKAILAENKRKLEEELAARKAALESRPKGMAKLKKDN